MISSFSGGLTSAYMTLMLKLSHPELRVVFFNTGMEHEKTLEFVNKCDKFFRLNIVWLESVVHHEEKKASTYRIVDFESAHRGADLFIEITKKYGLMGPGYLHCTRELKLNPFKAWKKEFAPKDKVAIGIRSDEIDRVDEKYKAKGIIYPLLDNGITKKDVNLFWGSMPFTLELPHHLGNCVGCWKKSDRKLMAVAKDYPGIFEELRKLEELDGSRKMFRGHRSTKDILAESQTVDLLDFIDKNNSEGCKESCEVFAS